MEFLTIKKLFYYMVMEAKTFSNYTRVVIFLIPVKL